MLYNEELTKESSSVETYHYFGRKSYLYFEEYYKKGRKLPLYNVYSRNDKTYLGRIKWNSGWRRYCFYPEDETLFDSKCLGEITRFIDIIMKGEEDED